MTRKDIENMTKEEMEEYLLRSELKKRRFGRRLTIILLILFFVLFVLLIILQIVCKAILV